MTNPAEISLDQLTRELTSRAKLLNYLLSQIDACRVILEQDAPERFSADQLRRMLNLILDASNATRSAVRGEEAAP